MSEKSDSLISVLIASSLKPAKDTRAWGKLGLSLRQTGQYSLNFMGFSQIRLQNYENEKYYTSLSSKYPSWGRISTQFRFLKVLWKVRPKILICCTYEYLPISSLFKRFFDYKLVYDVQENYVKNLELNPTLSSSKKARIGRLIKRMETVNGIDLFLLAENCYRQEMPQKTPFLILENKFAGDLRHVKPIQFKKKQAYRFLISGTLTPAFGTLDAILWFKEILKIYPESSLVVIGHCTLLSYEIELKKACKNVPQIRLKSSAFPIPHELIISAYSAVDFALLPYQNKAAIKDKLPTKLFEAAALGTPVLIGKNQKWIDFLAPFSGGSSIDFLDLTNAELQFNQVLEQEFFIQSPDETILWKSQQLDFITAINSL